jgi:predicted ATP-grasp superfamily ATP-dependent carboligase
LSTKTFLLTGGRAPATLELARHLHAHGHRVLMAESIPSYLCQRSTAVAASFQVPAPRYDPDGFIRSLQEILKKEKVDILLPTSEEIFTVAKGRKQLSPYSFVWTESLDKLLSLHNKWSFYQIASDRNFPVPKTWQVQSMSELEQLIAEIPKEIKLILKPCYSRFATHVIYYFHRHEPLPTIPVSSENPWIVQEWIEGKQICTYGISYKGKLLAHAAYQTAFTAGNGAGISFTPDPRTELRRLVQEIVKEICFTGQISFDWIESSEGIMKLIECNPRLTSGIHLFDTRDRLDRIFTQPEEASVLTSHPNRKSMIGLAMWSHGLPSVRSLSRFRQWLHILVTHRDVLFRIKDPLPFFYQGKSLLYLWRESRRLSISMLEASTHDIEWNGERR